MPEKKRPTGKRTEFRQSNGRAPTIFGTETAEVFRQQGEGRGRKEKNRKRNGQQTLDHLDWISPCCKKAAARDSTKHNCFGIMSLLYGKQVCESKERSISWHKGFDNIPKAHVQIGTKSQALRLYNPLEP